MDAPAPVHLKEMFKLIRFVLSTTKWPKIRIDEELKNFGAYRLEFSSSIRQLVGLGGLFCQLNVTEQGSLVTTI